MDVPWAELIPVGQRCLAEGLGEHEPGRDLLAGFAAAGFGPVQNMPVKKQSDAQAKRLQQVRPSRGGNSISARLLCSVP